MISFHVVEDPAAEVAERLAEAASAGGHIALSGGSTPKRAYELAAAARRRLVRRDAVVRRRALRRRPTTPQLQLPDGRARRCSSACRTAAGRGSMRIEGELGHEAAAGAYEALLREELGNHPRLDFALLGLGPDGHTASLFPGKPAVEEHRRLAAPVPEAGMDPQVPRVTLTLPVFNSAREVVFLVAGADKARRGGARVRRPAGRAGAVGARAPGRGDARRSCSTRPRPRELEASVISGHFIGLDVGGTKVAAATLDDGRPVGVGHRADRRQRRGRAGRQLAATIERQRRPDTNAVGIGVPSVIEFATGRVRHSVNLPLEDVPLRSLLTERIGLPVYVENDASCAALAEAYDDGELVCPHLVMFTVGTGVGGGLVLGGRLYRGATGAAAEVGHTIDRPRPRRTATAADPGAFPQRGSLEALASGPGARPARGAGRARTTATRRSAAG